MPKGGARAGSGPKPKPEKLSEPVTIRLTQKALARATELAEQQGKPLRQVVQELANAGFENR